MGSSPPSKVQKEPSTASSQLLNDAPSTRSPVWRSRIGCGFVRPKAYCRSRSLSPLKSNPVWFVWSTPPSIEMRIGFVPTCEGEKFLQIDVSHVARNRHGY